jgi:hypothetical protein
MALQAALLHGISHVQLETDSSILVIALDSLRQSSRWCHILELPEFIRLEFVKVEISFASRSYNMCAHELARIGLSWDSDHHCIVCTDPLPEIVNNLVVCDFINQQYNKVAGFTIIKKGWHSLDLIDP